MNKNFILILIILYLNESLFKMFVNRFIDNICLDN